jgi:2-haloalkanoic acid dehalogenase type II
VSARVWDVITFDCYGTLVDWEQGIGGAFVRAAAADGVTLEPAEVLRVYHEIEPIVEAEAYRRYRDVLGETARRVAARLGWPVSAARAGFVADSLPSWPPFPDTNPALERLSAAGYRLGILSNVDDDLLAGTRKHFSVDVPLVVTAEQVGSYKPAVGHFLTARRRIGDGHWLHAAQSYFHDVRPAKSLGVPVAWINRRAHPRPADGPAPDREFRSLGELADWLS